MAAMLASRNAISSNLLQKLLSPARPLASAVRSFNTDAQLRVQGNDDSSSQIDRVSNRPISRRGGSIFSDILDPFIPMTNLRQWMNMMDQMRENPFAAMSRGMGVGSRRGFDVREDENALYLRMDMPGLGKEDVKAYVEGNTLIIRGEGGKEFEEEEEEESGRRYSSRIDLQQKLFKIDEIKAEMKNGVLKVVVPKVKEEERKDVFQVKIEGKGCHRLLSGREMV